MRARNYVSRQPSDPDFDRSTQLTRKLARHSVNSVVQEQVRRGRDHNPNSPNKGATRAQGAPPPNPASTEMQNLWPILPGPGERGCGRSLADKSNRAQRLAGNRPERSWDHEQPPC